jgi:hypothetical protein
MGHVPMESRAYGESSDTSACSLIKAKRVSASAHALLANTSAIVNPGADNNHSGADHLTITVDGEHGEGASTTTALHCDHTIQIRASTYASPTTLDQGPRAMPLRAGCWTSTATCLQQRGHEAKVEHHGHACRYR